MMSSSDSRLWVWKDPEQKCIEELINHVKTETGNADVIVLRSGTASVSHGKLIAEYALELCQTFHLLESERTTYLNFKDHMLALELCVMNVNKKKVQDAEHDSNDLQIYHHSYVNECMKSSITDDTEATYIESYKSFLKHTNCTDMWHLYSLLQSGIASDHENLQSHLLKTVYLVLGQFQLDVHASLMKLLSGSDEVCNVVLERPLNISFDGSLSPKQSASTNITKSLVSIDDPSLVEGEDYKCSSATEEYAEDVMLAFLNLLVNSRNELSLSQAMASPIIGLSHAAFTDLKHVSVEKDMPMCQTVISYVTRIHLGGKGYAPPADCPLQCHLKGLGHFVDLLNQLQTILEETSPETAVKKAINVLKKRMLKCKDSSLRESSIVAVADALVEASISRMKKLEFGSEHKSIQIGQKSFDTLHSLVNYRKFCSDSFHEKKDIQQSNTHRTPLNLPPLMGYFRSPDEVECSEEESQASIYSKASTVNEATMDSSCTLSYFHSADSNSVSRSLERSETPKKVSFKGCFEKQEDVLPSTNSSFNAKEIKPLELQSNKRKAIAKRLVLEDVSNKKKPRRTADKKKPTTKLKLKPQIKGQGKISTFFTKA